MTSSKGICEECDVCYLQEIGQIQVACSPPCYEKDETNVPTTEAEQNQDTD